jgi:hypothetical protein
MTDNASSYGFRYVRSINGSEPKPFRGRVASGYNPTLSGTAYGIWPGDPVTLLSDGTYQVTIGAEGSKGIISGICVGVGPTYDGSAMQYKNYVPPNTVYSTNLERQTYIWIVPGPGSVFEVDVDDAVTATTEAAYQALCGENADHRLTTGLQPKANALLDISTHDTTNTLQWRILDVSQTAANQDYSGARVKLLVTPNVVSDAPFNTTGV